MSPCTAWKGSDFTTGRVAMASPATAAPALPSSRQEDECLADSREAAAALQWRLPEPKELPCPSKRSSAAKSRSAPATAC